MEFSNEEYEKNDLTIQEISNGIITKLNQKYNKDFLIRSINNRYGMGDFENVIAICSPKDNENILFNVIYNMLDEKIVDENFWIKDTSNELDEYVLKQFRNIGKNAIVKTEVFGIKMLEHKYSVQEFSNSFNNSNFLSTIIVDGAISNNELDEIFNNVKNEFKNIFLKTLIYTIPKEKFDDFYKKTCLLTEISETIIKEYSTNDLYIRKIYNNEIIKIK